MSAEYELECTDCGFQRIVTGEYAAVLETIEAHQDEAATRADDHFVNVRRRE